MDAIHILLLVSGLAAGSLISYFLVNASMQKKKAQLLKEAQDKADLYKKNREIEAKEKFIQMKAEHEKQIQERNRKVADAENAIRQQQAEAKGKEQSLKDKIDNIAKREKELDPLKEKLQEKQEAAENRYKEAEAMFQQQLKHLEKIAGLSVEEARNQLVEGLREEARTKASGIIKEIVDEAKMTAAKDSKRIVLQTIQRTAVEHAVENSVSVFNIDNDEVKGRIIGREGRNIRALEAATGIEIIVDDTPEAIILSGFDPIRREIARLSLHKLVTDGRIHPARIEEVVEKTTKQINNEIIEIGERTCIDMGVHGLHPELIRMVGRMRYRSSYGQNLLQHSREVANLCATMAAEMGLNTKLAKRAGLLHDIGKVPDDDPETPHALLGMKLAEKYKEHPEVVNAIGAHHDEIEMTSLLSPIVQACDAISGSRPGARREDTEQYTKRLKDLEGLAMSYKGVEKAFAIQAGRELRVIVEAERVSDEKADTLAFDISQKIMTDMVYPGQIKVTVIREKRSVSFAK